MNIIAGGGKYGSYAVEFLRKQGKSFTVVDVDRDCLVARKFGLQVSEEIGSEGEYFIKGDLRAVLDLIETIRVELVFPTVPTHLAADLASLKFGLAPWLEGINPILAGLPQAVVLQGGKGKLIVSFNRDHECIDKCAMPAVCPTSGTRKPCTMTALMRFASPDAFILLSHSVAPGLGALRCAEINEFFTWMEKKEKFVVGTACDCHGVFTAFRRQTSNVNA